MENVVEKFYEALKKLNISYNEETGRLSSPMDILIYSNKRRIPAQRIFIFKDYFLIFKDQEKDTRKIYFKNVVGFANQSNIIT